jgi:hypothetical protein
MDAARQATLLSPRERRNAMNDEPLTMAEHEVLGWPGVCKKLGSDGVERQTGPITTTLAA